MEVYCDRAKVPFLKICVHGVGGWVGEHDGQIQRATAIAGHRGR